MRRGLLPIRRISGEKSFIPSKQLEHIIFVITIIIRVKKERICKEWCSPHRTWLPYYVQILIKKCESTILSAGEESLNLTWKPEWYQMERLSLPPKCLLVAAEPRRARRRLDKGRRGPISQVNKSQWNEMLLYWNNGFPTGENMAADETQ